MGSTLQFYVKTAPGERVETAVTLPPGDGAVVTGVVMRADGTPAASAVVVALRAEDREPVGHCVADAQGFFVLGPLPAALYLVHVYDGAAPMRVVQIAL